MPAIAGLLGGEKEGTRSFSIRHYRSAMVDEVRSQKLLPILSNPIAELSGKGSCHTILQCNLQDGDGYRRQQ